MSLAVGTKLGPYEVVAPIGAGGMGEVFRARDPRLSREVAIKVLPAVLAQDRDRVARFRHEAQFLASLNHPNVAAIYGLEEADGCVALVMELAEGEDLARRLARGAIPLDEAVAIALRIAEGLEAAHDKGIVHRDLKPANVKVTRDGAVKVLDFGLAKALDEAPPPGGDVDLTSSPTTSRRMTEAGLLLGTAAYMAPEQARGKSVDKRADVWAFGVVLHEMLTGKRLFSGETVSDVLAAVLRQEVDLAALPPGTPAELRRLLRRCLERDPRNRLHDIADARLVLAEIPAGGAEDAVAPAPRPRASRREVAAWVLAAAALAVAATVLLGRSEPRAPRVVRASLVLPPGVSIELDGERSGIPALTPDGRRVAFGAREGAGPLHIWVAELATGAARPLPGTDGGYRPFWSPDGQRIGFFTWTHLATTPADGGPVTPLARARDARGGAWSPNGTIVYAPWFTGPLYAISENGGERRPLTDSKGDVGLGTHRFPQFLPGGDRFLFLDRTAVYGARAGGVFLRALGGGKPKPLLPEVTNALFAEGYLLTVRDGALVARAFDAKRGAVIGEPKVLVGDLLVNTRFAFGNFSAAGGNVLAFLTGRQKDLCRLVWRDRSGARFGELGTPGNISGYGGMALSADGRWAAIARIDETQDDGDIWLHDLSRGTETRLVRKGSDEFSPVFTPDSGAVIFGSKTNGAGAEILRHDLASGAETTLFSVPSAQNLEPMSITPDGVRFVYQVLGRDGAADAVLRPLEGKSGERVLVKDTADHAQISPDGRWLAWASDESGRFEIYVAPLASPGGSKVQVSRDGGTHPRWNPRGGELFYQEPDNVLTAVPVDAGSGTVSMGAPTRLFPIVEFEGWTYAVSPDGSRFLVREPIVEPEASRITLLTDWTSLLEGRRTR